MGYRFLIPERGTYRVELVVSPNNSSVAGKAMRVRAFSSGEEKEVLLLPDTFQAGDHRDGDWCLGGGCTAAFLKGGGAGLCAPEAVYLSGGGRAERVLSGSGAFRTYS